MTTQQNDKQKGLKNNPSKTEELDYFWAFIRSLPENTYLHELMDDNFGAYIERQIKNDFTFGAQEGTEFSAGYRVRKEMDDELKALKDSEASLKTQIQELKKENQNLKSIIAGKEAMIDKARKVLNGYGW